MPPRGVLVSAFALLTVLSNSIAGEPRPPALQPGNLSQPWQTGGPNCLTVPDWQVHAYNPDFYILRESGCIDAEKPFLYLIFGRDRALLEDTGVGEVPTAPFVLDLLGRWARRAGRPVPRLIVIHSHAHGDHIAGDNQFRSLPNVEFVAPTVEAVRKAASIANWPAGAGKIDLGGRIIDVLPIPGHNAVSIALYDRLTGNLLTGDSLYPGRLYVAAADIPTYAESAKRLADFAATHPIANVLGTHIEQGSRPYFDYPRGSTYQPEEHELRLSRAHVVELNEIFQSMGGKTDTVVGPDFSIVPRVPGVRAPAALQAGDGLGLQTGVVARDWSGGDADCVAAPDWQIRAYNEDVYILRESGCINPARPIVYLIFGRERALLVDNGIKDPALDRAIQKLLSARARQEHRASIALAGPTAGQVDLGGRFVDVPEPGMFYDRTTGILLTGNRLHPGLIRFGASDFAAYAASAQTAADFARTHPIAHVLGASAEGDIPDLKRAHIFEWNQALQSMGGKPRRVSLPDFTLEPVAR